MAFYKKFQSKLNNLWYPRAITVGKPVTTNQVADKLALMSTVTRGDTYAIMKNLGIILADYMAQGRTVKIDGIGTFYYTAATNKKGVESAEEVSSGQISGVRVRFIPEVTRNNSQKVTTRSLVDSNIFWEEWGGTTGSTTGGNGGTTGEGGNPTGGESGGETTEGGGME